MAEKVNIEFSGLGLVVFWLLAMLTSQVWYGTTSVLTSASTWVMWSFWGYFLLTIVLIFLSLLVIVLSIAFLVEFKL